MAKKKKKSTSSKPKRLSQSEAQKQLEIINASLEKQFGEGTVMNMGEAPIVNDYSFQIPTGSTALDMIIAPTKRLAKATTLKTGYKMVVGQWRVGVPVGKSYEIIGWESSGKTTTALLMVANAQAMGGTVGYIDMEHSLDPAWMRVLGVNTSKLQVSQPNSGEQALKIAEAWIKSGLFTMVVMDSVAAMVPEAELEADIDASHVGTQARMMSQGLRNLNPSIASSGTAVVFINQWRNKVQTGGFGGSNKTTPGGHALKFYASARVEVIRGTKINNSNGQHIGHTMIFKTPKNKITSPFQQSEAPFIYGRGIDKEREIVVLAKNMSIFDVSGAWLAYGEHKAQGEAQFVELMRQDPSLAYRLYDEVLSRNMAMRGLTPEGEFIEGFTLPTVTPTVEKFTPGVLEADAAIEI